MDKTRLELIQQMRKSNPEDTFLNYAAALEFKKNGNTDEAVSIFESIIANSPNYLAAYYQLGKMYEDTLHETKAIEIYKKGKVIALSQKDQKAIGELSEALMLLGED